MLQALYKSNLSTSKYAISSLAPSFNGLRIGSNTGLGQKPIQVRGFAKKNKEIDPSRPPSAAITHVYTLKPSLAKILGATEATRADMVKGVWAYIKENNLQEKGESGSNVNAINPDPALLSLKPDLDIPWKSHDVMRLFSGNYDSTVIRQLTEDELVSKYPDKEAIPLYFEWMRQNPDVVARREAKNKKR